MSERGCAEVEELADLVSSVLVPLRVTAPVDHDFRATVESGDAGPVTVARLRSTPHLVSREPNRITSTDPDLVKAVLHLRGHMSVAQDDRGGPVRRGELVVFDTARPYSLSVTGDCDVVVVGIPRALLGARAEQIATATPVALDTGIRAVIGAFLTELGDHAAELPGSRGRSLGDALACLLIAVFTETGGNEHETGTGLTDRILAYTQANLSDPGLSVASVARAHGISSRQLHKLFLARGHTFAAWVRTERLTRIRRDLLDPALARRTTAAIAARWGIPDPSNLSRRLKAEFGHTAAEIRRGDGARNDESRCADRRQPDRGDS